jgi:mRNA interferase RelE/StbE
VTYELLLTREAQRFYERAEPPLIRRLHRCFEHLRENPYENPNITRLRGPLTGYLRYRVGDWRVVYEVDEDRHLVTILLIAHRSKAYR